MVKTPRFIDFSELSEDLKHFIQAGAKIFPIDTYEDLPTVKVYEFYRVLGGVHKNEIYAWHETNGRYELIGADDRDIQWNDVKYKPLSFPPSTHQHNISEIGDFPSEFIPSAHQHSTGDITDFPSEEIHFHQNKSILDLITQPLIDLWNTVVNKVDVVEGKGLSTNDFTNTDKQKLDALTEDAGFDYTSMQQELNNHKNSNDHDGRYYTKSETTTALSSKAEKSIVDGHIGSSTIHVTQTDKDNWNGKAEVSTVNGHINNSTVHVTQTDKDYWNGKADSGVEVVTSTPSDVQANQVFFLEVT